MYFMFTFVLSIVMFTFKIFSLQNIKLFEKLQVLNVVNSCVYLYF